MLQMQGLRDGGKALVQCAQLSDKQELTSLFYVDARRSTSALFLVIPAIKIILAGIYGLLKFSQDLSSSLVHSTFLYFGSFQESLLLKSQVEYFRVLSFLKNSRVA